MFWNKPKPIRRSEGPYRVPTFTNTVPETTPMSRDTKAAIIVFALGALIAAGIAWWRHTYPAPTIAHRHMVAARAAGVTTQRVHGYQPTRVYCYGEPGSCSLHDGVRCLVSWPGATRRQTWCCDTHEGHENRGCLNVN